MVSQSITERIFHLGNYSKADWIHDQVSLLVSSFSGVAAMSGSTSSRGLRQEWTPGHIVEMTDAEIEEYNRQLDRQAEMQQAISDSVKERKVKCLL